MWGSFALLPLSLVLHGANCTVVQSSSPQTTTKLCDPLPYLRPVAWDDVQSSQSTLDALLWTRRNLEETNTHNTNSQTCTCLTTCYRSRPRVATRSLYSVRLGCCCTHYMQHNDNHHCLVPRVDPMMSLTKLSRQFWFTDDVRVSWLDLDKRKRG